MIIELLSDIWMSEHFHTSDRKPVTVHNKKQNVECDMSYGYEKPTKNYIYTMLTYVEN